ncbi:MAG: hypothetical protein NTW29_08245 [Bacteroidetes bacterium]|nr:hypothetical protein [Bacteroidota bacterium]
MKNSLYLLVISYALNLALACNEADSTNIPVEKFEKGHVNVNFKGEVSGYSWNFKREVKDGMRLIKRNRIKGAEMLSIQVNEGKLFAVSPGNSKIYFLNDSLEIYDSWGVKGESKHENGNILFYNFSNNFLHVYDFRQKAMKKYDFRRSRDSLVAYFPLKSTNAVFRTCFVTENNYLYVNTSDSLGFYDFVIADSTSITGRIPVLQNAGVNKSIQYPQMIYDGSFVYGEESRYIAYCCNFTGLFIYFDKSNLNNPVTVTTLDKTPPPKAYNAELAPNTFRLQIEPSVVFFPASCIFRNNLYILNAIDPHNRFVIDIYDLDNKGAYAKSIYVPRLGKRSPISIALTNSICNVLYNDQTIASYIIEPV